MLDIWGFLDINGEFQVRLFRTAPQQFCVIENGAYKQVLHGPPYSLVHKMYASLFRQLTDQVEVFDAVIVDNEFNTTTYDYVELAIHHALDYENIYSVDATGSKVWELNGYIFVSTALKQDMEQVAGAHLTMSHGLSYLAG